MTIVAILAALLVDDPTYAELSRRHGLAAADRLLREGKALEAAVAYRNILLMPGDREAVRIPLALALLAKGDAVSAGIEIRRAHMLCPDFSRLVIDPAELFGSKGALAQAASSARGRDGEGDEAEVSAAKAYAYVLEGDKELAQKALANYVQSRGEDAFARDLKALASRTGGVKAPVAPPPLPPAAAPLRGGEPVRAGARSVEPEARLRGEILAR
jgi:hypothetical protein